MPSYRIGDVRRRAWQRRAVGQCGASISAGSSPDKRSRFHHRRPRTALRSSSCSKRTQTLPRPQPRKDATSAHAEGRCTIARYCGLWSPAAPGSSAAISSIGLPRRRRNEGHAPRRLFTRVGPEPGRGAGEADECGVVTGLDARRDRPSDRAIEGCNRIFHLAVQCVRRSLGNPRRESRRQCHRHARGARSSAAHKVRRLRLLLVLGGIRQHVAGVAPRGRRRRADRSRSTAAPSSPAKFMRKPIARPTGCQPSSSAVQCLRSARAHDRGDLAEVIPRFVIRVLNGLPPVIFGDGSERPRFHLCDRRRAWHCARRVTQRTCRPARQYCLRANDDGEEVAETVMRSAVAMT